MSVFTSDAPTSSVSDFTKRVRYSTGLVLGVDEFNQDQAYFMERDRLLTRALHGYGVVQGLRPHLEVRSADSADDVAQIRVEPGLAIAPSGQHVCIDRPQCAVVWDWLAQQDPSTVFPSYESNGEAGPNGGGEPPPDVEPKEVCVSVVLRYGICETDFVPIPGEPCRSAEESTAASRLADDFSLALEFDGDRPPQVEEHAIRLLGRLLRALEVRPSGPYVLDDGGPDLNGLIVAVPDALSTAGTPAEVSLSDLTDGAGVTLPTDDSGRPLLPVQPGRETAVLRAVEEVWTTRTRRMLLETGHDDKTSLAVGQGTDGRCQPVPKGDDGIVLGTLCLAVEPREKQGANGTNGLKPAPKALAENGILDTSTLQVSTEDRPRLLSSRVLQETGGFDRAEPGSDADAPDTLSTEEVADTLPTLPFATADLVDPARLPGVEASEEEVAVRIRFHLNTHETVTTQDNAYDVGEDFNVQVFSERSDPMTDYLYLTKESVQDRARLGRNVYVLLLRETSVQNRPYLRLRFDLSDMRINRRAANGDGTRGEVSESFSGTDWIEERPVKWVGHDGTKYVTVFAGGRAAGGDLNGLQSVPRVTGIQETSVSESPPEEGDLLQVEEEGEAKKWTPTSPSNLDLDFAPADHTHALDDLSGVSVSQPSDGEMLTWKEEAGQNGEWVPERGGREFDPSTLVTDYVKTNPETDESYAIVAAGRVTLEDQPKVETPKYGELELNGFESGTGQFWLSFEGYLDGFDPGSEDNPYVVNGTPITQQLVGGEEGEGRLGPTFSVLTFTEEGILVQCVQQTVRFDDGVLTTEPEPFMVEISEIGRQRE